MRCITAVLTTFTLSSLLSAPSFAQQATLSIPVTVPAPPPVTVQVQQKITVGALTYLATGALTLTPVATTADLPPVVGPQPDWPLSIGAYFDASGKQSWTYHVGDLVRISGNAFGETPGTVKIGLTALPTATWTDQDITLALAPSLVQPGDGYQTVEVDAADGKKYAQEMGIIIQPAPAPAPAASEKVARKP